jgi:phosphoribosylglycinamide formyltransferase 1
MNKKWALFFSGQGTNLEAILNKYHKSWVHKPVLITNNPKALGLKIAEKFHLEAIVLDKPINFSKLSEYLKSQNVERIFLLGFLKIIPPEFLKDWVNQIFNLHPSLLPMYPGLNSIERAFNDKQDIGVSIHKVTEGVDQGEILVQNKVLKAKDYDPLSLEEVKTIVHSKEHQIVCDFIPLGEKNLGSKI